MTAQRKKGSAAAFLIGLALALALGIAVLSTLVWCVGTHDGLMARWMLETAPPGDTGLPAAAYAPLCKALCSYLRGGTSVFDFLQGGVSLFNTSEKLHLADCAARFFRENGGSGQCVGECCAQGRLPYLAFYTQSLITRIVFQSESRVKELLHKKTPAFQRLRAMRDKLTELGYTLYDIT